MRGKMNIGDICRAVSSFENIVESNIPIEEAHKVKANEIK